MNVLDLFSGIGGFSLGLERAGMRTVAFCEINPFCRAVLKKHWPKIPIFHDVTTLLASRMSEGGIYLADTARNVCTEQKASGAEWKRIGARCKSIDLICGGFPCQDISVAGKGAGIAGSRSGLWSEYARIIGEVRPRYVIVENVAALLGRGLERVLGDLATLGYDAEWHCIPASAVGAPHRRDRVWIIANTGSSGRWPDAARYGLSTKPTELQQANWEAQCNREMAHAAGAGRRSERAAITGEKKGGRSFGEPSRAGEVSDPRRQSTSRYGSSLRSLIERNWWEPEPNVGRVAHGVPARVDRIRSLGNAVIPQIPEIIGRAILEAESLTCRQRT